LSLICVLSWCLCILRSSWKYWYILLKMNIFRSICAIIKPPTSLSFFLKKKNKIINQFDVDFMTSWPIWYANELGFCCEAIHGLEIILIRATAKRSRRFCRTIYFQQWWSQVCLVHTINTAYEIERMPDEEASTLHDPPAELCRKSLKKHFTISSREKLYACDASVPINYKYP